MCGGVAGKIPEGLGTALKPAFEPIVVARKPLAGTVAANVLAWGTGALNIGATRVGLGDEAPPTGSGVSLRANSTVTPYRTGDGPNVTPPAGRWPTNVLLDDTQAAELDRQSGNRPGFSGGGTKGAGFRSEYVGGDDKGWTKDEPSYFSDSGGASRFFPTFRYEAKAPASERPRIKATGSTGRVAGTPARTGRECNVCGNRTVPPGGSPWPACGHEDWSTFTTEDKSSDYVAHPTVKPLDLMRWLVRLVTPPGGTVLDPFAGSGTTAEACVVEGFRCVLIEREADYLPLIVARLSKPIAPVFDLEGLA